MTDPTPPAAGSPAGGRGGAPRRFARARCMIPTHVTVDHAWESSAPNAFSGMLLNISRGGATLRLAGTLAPRTRLRLALPTSAVARNLPAQVVWTSAIPGRRRRSAIYGIRWMEEFSPQVLDALRMLLGPESA